MQKQELLETLQSLHRELQQADQVDRQTLDHLQLLMDDILDLASRSHQADAADVQSLAERWRTLLLTFESEHPQLSEAVNRISSGLANLGI